MKERAEFEVRKSMARTALEDYKANKYYPNEKPKDHMPIVYKG